MGCVNESLIKWSRSRDQDAAMPIYGKNLKNHRLWNKKADDLERWYAALGTQVLQSLSPMLLCMNNVFFRNYCSQ